MEEIQQKLSIMLEAKGAQASIKEAMNGATGDAIVRLEFEEANKTLDKMLNSLTTIEEDSNPPMRRTQHYFP